MTRPDPPRADEATADLLPADIPDAELAAAVVALLAGPGRAPESDTGVNRWRRQRIAALRQTSEDVRYRS